MCCKLINQLVHMWLNCILSKLMKIENFHIWVKNEWECMEMNGFVQMSMWIARIECEMSMMSMNDVFIVKYYWKFQVSE